MEKYTVDVLKRNSPDSDIYTRYCNVSLTWNHSYESNTFYEDIKQRFPYPEFLLEFVRIETKEVLLDSYRN